MTNECVNEATYAWRETLLIFAPARVVSVLSAGGLCASLSLSLCMCLIEWERERERERQRAVSTKQGVEPTQALPQSVCLSVWELFTQARLAHCALQTCGSVHRLNSQTGERRQAEMDTVLH